VRASIAGSIIGNILLVLGLSVFVGGLKYKVQVFDKAVAGKHTVMMILAVIALFTPSLFVHAIPGTPDTASNPNVESLSLWVSGILIVLYLGSLLYSLKTHEELFRGKREREPPAGGLEAAQEVERRQRAQRLMHSCRSCQPCEFTV